MREGTAKFADTTGENDRHLQKVFQKQVSSDHKAFNRNLKSKTSLIRRSTLKGL